MRSTERSGGLGTRSLRIQPAELVKVTVILVLAVIITKLGKKINEWRVWGMLAALIGPLALLVTANNLSSGIIIVGIAFVMMFVACKRKWPFVLTAALIAAVILFAEPVALALEQVGILHEYQLERILVWKEPEAYAQDGGFQVLQGLYAIGSGGLLGKGLGQSIQKLSFLPEPQNDMIFAIICEELGLFGAVSVILIFLFMLYRFMVIAGNAPGSVRRPFGGRGNGPYRHPGGFKYRGCYQRDSQIRELLFRLSATVAPPSCFD